MKEPLKELIKPFIFILALVIFLVFVSRADGAWKVSPRADVGVVQTGITTLTGNTANLNGDLLTRFDRFRSYIYVTYGVTVEIASGWRSYQEQEELYRIKPRGMAARPGTSNHEKGLAIDYYPVDARFALHLAEFGLTLPMRREQWHIQRIGD